MPNTELLFSPATVLRVDAIGKPGERVFYVQGGDENKVVTLLAEKYQVQALALGLEKFISDLQEKFPHLSHTPAEYDEEQMRILPPVDVLFKIGELSIGYDLDSDRVVLVLREELSGNEDEQPSSVQFWCGRSMISALAVWSGELVSRGRPTWPASGEPIIPLGQFSPRHNGHK